MSNKEPIALMLKDIEKLAKRINALIRKLNVMGLQEDERKEYYSLISKYASSRLELADRIFDSELLPSLQNDESTELSLILKSKLNWDTSLLIKPEDVDRVTNTYAKIENKNKLADILNDYFSILTNNLIQLLDSIQEDEGSDLEIAIISMGKLLATHADNINLFNAKKLIHDHLLYKFETIYMIVAEDEKD